MSRSTLAIALPFLLGACTTMYPPLYSAPTIANTASPSPLGANCRNNTDPLNQTIACAELLQDVYSKGYVESAKWNDFSQLPIIGAAGAAAWILLKDQPKAARKVGKIGIGTGVYAAGRGQLLPVGLPEVFIKGHGALGCVLAEGPYFRGTGANSSVEALNKSLADTATFATITSRLRYTEPSDPAASSELLKAARALADQAIAAANAQLRTSRQERAAYEFAASPFRQSVSDIAGWVASKGRVRPNTSYDDLLKGMSSGPPKAAPPTSVAPLMAFVSSQPTSAELIGAIGAASQGLTEAVLELQGNTPPYAARLTKVAKCATDLPTG
jgi:hypothetical protein